MMRRLADDAPEDLRAMIAAARADAPPAAVLDRILARVEQGGPPPRPGLARRWLVLGGGAAVAIAIATAWLLRAREQDRPPPAPAPSATPAAPVVAPPPPAAPPPAAPVVSRLPDQPPPDRPPPRPARAGAPHRHAQAPAPPAAPPPSEVSLVEQARAALAARDLAGALAAAARHQALYPSGVLAEEREAIAIEALAASGQRAAARDRLQSFNHRFPGSSYRRHLDELVPPP